MSQKIFLFFSSFVGVTLLVLGAISGSLFVLNVGILFSFTLVGLVGLWFLTRSKPKSIAEGEMISMVALFESLPFLNETVLARHVKSAWGLEFETDDEAETFVAGNSPLFVIKTEDRIYTINHFDRPYFDNVDELVGETRELRMKQVLEAHRGWISVDLMSKSKNMDLEYEYSKIGQLLNEMVDDQGLGILLPQYMRLVPWDNSAELAITSDTPLANLSPSNPPVFPIEDNDPEMQAAVSRARLEWPAFVREFESHMRDEDRNEARKFSVKTPITVDGRTEYIWMNVTGIENGIIYGTLCNEPVSLRGLREGDRVRTSENLLNDWVYTKRNSKVGGYTIKVLSQQATSQIKESN